MQSGVPQGSVLGPVLFLLFVNDMPLFINEAYVDIYADDSTLHTASKKLETVEEPFKKVQKALKPGAYPMECTSVSVKRLL